MPLLNKNEFLESSVFPPERERRRIDDMERWHQLSIGDYTRLQADNEKVYEKRIKMNVFRVVMNFWKDAAIPTDLLIEYEGNERVQEIIDQTKVGLLNSAKLVVQNMIRYGCGVFINRQLWNVQSVDPRYWFPVVLAYDESDIQSHIVAYPFNKRPNTAQIADSLAVYDFDDGMCKLQIRNFSGNSIGSVRESISDTKCGEIPLVPVYMNEFRIYGRSDFPDMIPFVNEAMRRESAISRALDKHAHPHLAVPEGSFQLDENKQVVISDEGMLIPIPEGGAAPSYVSWTSAFTDHMESAKRSLYRALQMTGITPFLIDRESNAKAGFPATGVALRRLAMVTVNKLNSIRMLIDDGLKDAIVGMFSYAAENGEERFAVDREKIKITFPLPFDVGNDMNEDGLDDRQQMGEDASEAQAREPAEDGNDQPDMKGERMTRTADEKGQDKEKKASDRKAPQGAVA